MPLMWPWFMPIAANRIRGSPPGWAVAPAACAASPLRAVSTSGAAAIAAVESDDFRKVRRSVCFVSMRRYLRVRAPSRGPPACVTPRRRGLLTTMLKTIVWPAPTADIASSLHACTLLVVFRQEVLVRPVRVTPSLALVLALAAGAVFVRADGTPQALPFTQAWTDPTQIAANDTWTGVPGIQGYLGQNITTATGVDPQTLLTTSAVADDLDVSANQTNPNTFNTGGVAEFDGIANPTIALNGSGTADAPYILLGAADDRAVGHPRRLHAARPRRLGRQRRPARRAAVPCRRHRALHSTSRPASSRTRRRARASPLSRPR